MNIMLDIQQKRKIRGVAYHRVTIGVLFLFTLVAIHSTWVVYEKKVESEKLKYLAMKRVSDLESRDVDLQNKMDRLGTSVGIEEEIRAKFSVAKENENMVIVVDESKIKATTTSSNGGFWKKIKSIFW